MRSASAAPSIGEGASNHAVATPSTTRQSVPISVMPGTVAPIPDDLRPDSDHVPAGALMDTLPRPAPVEQVTASGLRITHESCVLEPRRRADHFAVLIPSRRIAGRVGRVRGDYCARRRPR
jgi:hypothetical protein